MSEKLVEMKYMGLGTKPANLFVKESEVASLEKTKMWETTTKRKKVSSNG